VGLDNGLQRFADRLMQIPPPLFAAALA
jgi:hypothetical protein